MMPATPIVSCGPLADIDGFRGVVHAAFPSSVYLAPPEGPMLVIHDIVHGHTPTSLLVRDVRTITGIFSPGDVVTGRTCHLRVKDSLFDARQATRWHMPPPPCATTSPTSPIPRASSSLGASASAPATVADAEARLGPTCRRLTRALAQGRGMMVPDALASLVGAGPGLTPSGDDAVVGILAVLHRSRHYAPVELSLSRLSRHLPRLLHRTTPLSAHYLTLALQGHVGEHLTQLIDACLTTTAEDLDPSLVHRVLATGATSGADVLVAVSIALSLVSFLGRTRGHPVPQIMEGAA